MSPDVDVLLRNKSPGQEVRVRLSKDQRVPGHEGVSIGRLYRTEQGHPRVCVGNPLTGIHTRPVDVGDSFEPVG